jgi:transposase
MVTVETAETVVTLKKAVRRRRPKLERRQIVEETLKPGTSVSLVARAHDVNTNQLFKWRKQYLEGRLEVKQTSGTMLPVKMADSDEKLRPVMRRESRQRRSGIIDIDLGHARVRIEGTADPDCVRAALEGLSR